MRGYLANTEGLEPFNHWERLKMIKLSSIERRHERYKITYIWKVVNGLCPNFGLDWEYQCNNGLMIKIPVLNAKVTERVKTLRYHNLYFPTVLLGRE